MIIAREGLKAKVIGHGLGLVRVSKDGSAIRLSAVCLLVSVC